MINPTVISVCIWDFDGTFYRPDPGLFGMVRAAEIRVIMEHKKLSFDTAEALFQQYYRVKSASATEAVAMITGQTTAAAAQEMEEYYDRRPYLRRDQRLIDLFASLHQYTHYLLANGIARKIRESLAVLGVPETTFTEIVTSETVGVNKPNPAGYRYILGKTGLPPERHIMIGDRPVVDLSEAKKQGMQTCLVWVADTAPYIDAVLPDVYGVGPLLAGA